MGLNQWKDGCIGPFGGENNNILFDDLTVEELRIDENLYISEEEAKEFYKELDSYAHKIHVFDEEDNQYVSQVCDEIEEEDNSSINSDQEPDDLITDEGYFHTWY
jgi:hypothetical protein